MKITLTKEEIKNAELVAGHRRKEDIQKGYKVAWGQSNDPDKIMRDMIEGSYYEAAVCKFLQLPYTKGVLRGDDAGRYQVRGTTYPNGRLILHPEDHDSKIYILVVGEVPEFTLYGWILGVDGKKDEYWDDPAGGRPAFFVPQSVLNKDIGSLKT